MRQTNFDRYLKEQLADPDFAKRFEQAGEAWDVELQVVRTRRAKSPGTDLPTAHRSFSLVRMAIRS